MASTTNVPTTMENTISLNELNLVIFVPIFFVAVVTNGTSIGYIAKKFDVKKHIFARFVGQVKFALPSLTTWLNMQYHVWHEASN